MNSLPPLPAGCVPQAGHHILTVVENPCIARDTYRLRVHAPELARHVVPGQFFMVRVPGRTDPLLGRPFALFDTVLDEQRQPLGLDIVYLKVGKMTGLLSTLDAGDRVELWGPLGNGFPLPSAGRLVIVAGGVGQTPFLAVAREALGLRGYGVPTRTGPETPSSVTVCFGARNEAYFVGLEEFASLQQARPATAPAFEVKLATDDGSRGHQGFVTQLAREVLEAPGEPAIVYCCGPEPMMHATAKLCQELGVECWLSLETPMACGFGVCFSCVTKVRLPDESWDYRRVCVEGPIFRAKELVLE